jgi:hypothetical protein
MAREMKLTRERWEQIAPLIEQGLDRNGIARRLDISRERVRQVIDWAKLHAAPEIAVREEGNGAAATAVFGKIGARTVRPELLDALRQIVGEIVDERLSALRIEWAQQFLETRRQILLLRHGIPAESQPDPAPAPQALPLGELECVRCGYRWLRRQPTTPRRCAGCGSRLWNIPRRRKRKLEHQAKRHRTYPCPTCRAECPSRFQARVHCPVAQGKS